jgi:hypothetical protein
VVGELLCFKSEVIKVDYGPPGDPAPYFRCETVMKVVVIWDGVESCHVSFT